MAVDGELLGNEHMQLINPYIVEAHVLGHMFDNLPVH